MNRVPTHRDELHHTIKNNYIMMKKINEKRLFFVSSYRLKLLIMTKLCVLLLVCSMTSLSAAASVFSYNDGLLDSNPELTDSGIDQQLTVRGTIKDASTGEPLAGVTVVVKGTTVGTLSDGNGRFSIAVPSRDALLSFSFIGFTTHGNDCNCGDRYEYIADH